MKRITGVLVATIALAACGGSSTGGSAASSTTTTVVGTGATGVTTAATTATTAGTTTAPTTAATTTPTTAATTVATTAPPAGSDLRACLQGDWIMKRGTLDLFVATLMPVPGLSMPDGNLSLSFAGDRVVYKGNGTMRFAFGDIVMEATSSWTHTGTFRMDGTTVLMEWSERVNEMGEFRVNGQSAPLPAPDTPPAVTGGPASCTPTTLTFETTSTGAERIQMIFDRA